jgi:hypothetical protein
MQHFGNRMGKNKWMILLNSHRNQMRRESGAILATLVVALLALSLVGYEYLLGTTGGFVTGTSVNIGSDSFLTGCTILGQGGLELRVVSDFTGIPVHGESVNAVDRLGCNSATQVVYFDNFSMGQGGWLGPVFPAQAMPAGVLNFTVIYQGTIYNLSAAITPMGTTCVTLHVPSGKVTTATSEGPC